MKMRSSTIALDKIYKRRDRYEIPDWQREAVWSTEKSTLLIDSILRGWKLPKFYFVQTGENPDVFEVVDGQQRLAAIWAYFDGEIALGKSESLPNAAGSYKTLPDSLSDAFDDFEIECDIIDDYEEDEIRDFFQRLQSGLPLNSSERLNAVKSGLRDYSHELSTHDFFTKTTTVPAKRYAYFDICAKVLAVELEGLDTSLRFEEMERVFKSNGSYSSQSASAKRVKKALDWLHGALPADSSELRSRAIVQSLVTLTCHLISSGMKKPAMAKLARFVTSFSHQLSDQVELGKDATQPDLILFQSTVNANSKTGTRTRHSILLHRLLRASPEIYSALNASSALQDQLATQIESNASRIRDLIKRINDEYSGRHGIDFFKPTNETASALASLHSKVDSQDAYVKYVSDLYHVFRESIGQRMTKTWPESFRDINDLRTAEQHDVDHGKSANSKRKKLAETFTRYSGTTSTESASPSQFELTQSNILAALVTDLEDLAKNIPGPASKS